MVWGTLVVVCGGLMAVWGGFCGGLVEFWGVSMDQFSSVICRVDNRKCIIPWIGMLTGYPLCRESQPPMQVKEPSVI